MKSNCISFLFEISAILEDKFQKYQITANELKQKKTMPKEKEHVLQNILKNYVKTKIEPIIKQVNSSKNNLRKNN